MTGPGCGWSKISRVRAPYDNLGPAVKPLQSPESAVYIMDSLLAVQSARPATLCPVFEHYERTQRAPGKEAISLEKPPCAVGAKTSTATKKPSAHPAFRGDGVTSSSISAPNNVLPRFRTF